MARTGQQLHTRARHEGEPSDALMVWERDVLELWDAGLATNEIARRLDLAEEKVERCVGYYDECRLSEFTFAAMARAGCAAMLAALARTGGSYA